MASNSVLFRPRHRCNDDVPDLRLGIDRTILRIPGLRKFESVQGVNQMKATFWSVFMHAFRQGPRIFFAPLVAAFNAMREEANRPWTYPGSAENGRNERTERATNTATGDKHI